MNSTAAPPSRPREGLRRRALAALAQPDPSTKVQMVVELHAAAPEVESGVLDCPTGLIPGRPLRPELVAAVKVPSRSAFTPQGHAALMHSICHIEFNAINLALDAIWRFADLPEAYYRDWLQVAREEAFHFSLLSEHLQSLGHAYGDFSAHDGLWTMCEKTAADVLARMALVPRTLEARGLDATPQIQARLRRAGSPDALRAVALLDIILRDEVGHVAIGNRWYRWLCERDGREPERGYAELVARYQPPRLRAPFNLEARRAAGFTPDELAALHS